MRVTRSAVFTSMQRLHTGAAHPNKFLEIACIPYLQPQQCSKGLCMSPVGWHINKERKIGLTMIEYP